MMEEMQSFSVGEAVELARAGDASRLSGVQLEEVLRTADAAVPSMLSLCSSPVNTVVTAVWKILVGVASSPELPQGLFALISKQLLSQLRSSLGEQKLMDPTTVRVARFFLQHFSALLKSSPTLVAQTVGVEVLHLTTDLLVQLSLLRGFDDTVISNIAPRLMHAASTAMAAQELSHDDRLGFLRELLARESSVQGAGAATVAWCKFLVFTFALRDVGRVCTSDESLFFIETLLLWLPQVEEASDPDDSLGRGVRQLGRSLPPVTFYAPLFANGKEHFDADLSLYRTVNNLALSLDETNLVRALAATTKGLVCPSRVTVDVLSRVVMAITRFCGQSVAVHDLLWHFVGAFSLKESPAAAIAADTVAGIAKEVFAEEAWHMQHAQLCDRLRSSLLSSPRALPCAVRLLYARFNAQLAEAVVNTFENSADVSPWKWVDQLPLSRVDWTPDQRHRLVEASGKVKSNPGLQASLAMSVGGTGFRCSQTVMSSVQMALIEADRFREHLPSFVEASSSWLVQGDMKLANQLRSSAVESCICNESPFAAVHDMVQATVASVQRNDDQLDIPRRMVGLIQLVREAAADAGAAFQLGASIEEDAAWATGAKQLQDRKRTRAARDLDALLESCTTVLERYSDGEQHTPEELQLIASISQTVAQIHQKFTATA